MRWTDDEIEFLEREYENLTRKELAESIGRTESAVCTKLYSLGLRKTIIWTPELDKKLTELYTTTTNKELALIFGCSKSGIKSRGKVLRINKGGNQGRFKKGQIPPNKGKKMDAETYERVKHTFFQKGNIPPQLKKIGSASVDKYGYYKIKVGNPRKWEFVHRLLWKKTHPGEKISKNEIIIFIDGNKENLAIDNLQKIDRKQHMENSRMTDGYLAFLIERDAEKREVIINNYPELIELKRNVLKLRKTIRDGYKQQD